MFWGVGVTKYCKLQYKMLTDSTNALRKDPRPISNTMRTPMAKAIWGMKLSHKSDPCIEL